MRTRAAIFFPIGLFFCALLWSAAGQDPAPAEIRSPRRVSSFEHINQELVLRCDAGTLIIKAWADPVIQVRYYPRSARASLPLWGIQPAPAPPKYRVDSTPDAILLSTPLMTVSVDRKTARLTFHDSKQNQLLASDQIRLESSQSGAYRIQARFEAPEDETYYGLGQHSDGGVDQRGKTVRLRHGAQPDEPDTIAVPFLVTNRRYGFAFDNPSMATVTPGKDGVTSWDAEAGDALSYFVVFGNTTDEIYRGYRTLTGAAPMPPRAALGFIQDVPHAAGQEEVLQLARKYREANYPSDMLAIRFAADGMDAQKWPDPAAMNAELDKLGFQALVAPPLRIPADSPRLEALDAMGCIVKDKNGKPGRDVRGALIDMTKASCAAWFWNDIQEKYQAAGFQGWLLAGDPSDLISETLVLDAGPAARLYNVFAPLRAKAVFDGQKKDLRKRQLIFSRWAYLGSQKYGALGFSEWTPRWNSLAAQVPAGLAMSASGFPFWAATIAAQADVREDDYAELFTRWLEFASFCPMFRAAGPIPVNPVAARAASRYLALRYRLLPYIYSIARTSTETGAPFMRPLFMDFGQDPEVRDIRDQYMFGPSFLVAPVTAKGGTGREVYLPKGASWQDYWTGKKYPGGQRVAVEAPLDVLPLFVRGGSVIPHGNPVANTRSEQREIELWVYPGADAQFDFYQDDGATYAYEKGNFSLAQIRWNEAAQKIAITGDDRKVFSRPQDRWLKIIR